MESLQFYESLLRSVLVEDTTGAGLLTAVVDPEKPSPVNIGGKRLVLPVKDILREGRKEDQIIFHPLSENITRGESDVIKSLRDFIQWRLTTVVQVLAEEMGRVAASPSEHKKLGPKASKYLQELSDFDEKTFLALKKLLERINIADPDRRVLTISLRQGSKSKSDGIIRSAAVVFPILEELKNTDTLEVFGQNLPSKKAKARIFKLFEIILGTEEERAIAEYSYGTRDQSAPYLHALLTSYSRLADRLNTVTETHAKLLGEDTTALLTIETTWTEYLDGFAKLRNQIPPQTGNEGAIRVTDKSGGEAAPASTGRRTLAPPPTDRKVEMQIDDLPWEEQSTDRQSSRSSREEERPSKVFRRDDERQSSRQSQSSDGRQSLDDYLDNLRGGSSNSSRSGGIFTRRDPEERRGGFSRGNNERGGRHGGDRGFRASRRGRF